MGELFMEMHRFFATDAKSAHVRERLKPVFARFDPLTHASLDCLAEFSHIVPTPLSGDDGATAHQSTDALHTFANSEFQPTTIFSERLNADIRDAMDAMEDKCDPSSYPSCSELWRSMFCHASKAEEYTDNQSTGKHDLEGQTVVSDNICMPGAQRKPDLPSIRDSQIVRSRAPLIVVASLVDITANLAGLSRTSEIFNCQSLCLRSSAIVKDPAFQTISVKSERWLPICEVPRDALRAHLLELRQRGFTLVGVEQTHYSVPLQQYRFSERSVLILGNEKAGIDADLLPILDCCVEIPQWGQLRSLNVHASGTIAIWEYTRQQLCADVDN